MSRGKKLTHTTLVAAAVVAGATASNVTAAANPDSASVTGVISSFLAQHKLRDDFQQFLKVDQAEGAFKSNELLVGEFLKFSRQQNVDISSIYLKIVND